MASSAAQDLSHAPSVIAMKGVNKWYGQFHVLTDINLDVKLGEKIVVCGPSGSGKSTLIRCINRLEEHQQGNIIVDGVTLSNDVKNIEAIRREVGMVFQSFNLFPHLTILDNLTAGVLVFDADGALETVNPGATRTAMLLSVPAARVRRSPASAASTPRRLQAAWSANATSLPASACTGQVCTATTRLEPRA